MLLQDDADDSEMLSIFATLWIPVPVETLHLWFLNPGRYVCLQRFTALSI